MSSVTNSSGLNYQNGVNPLGRKVRALEADVDTLKKEMQTIKAVAFKTSATSATPAAAAPAATLPPTMLAEFEEMKQALAAIKAAGFGKGEKGDKGEKGERGEKGEKGDAGPMTYIAMPPQMMAAAPTPSATS